MVADPVVVADSVREDDGFLGLVAAPVHVGGHAHQSPAVVVVVAIQGPAAVSLPDRTGTASG